MVICTKIKVRVRVGIRVWIRVKVWIWVRVWVKVRVRISIRIRFKPGYHDLDHFRWLQPINLNLDLLGITHLDHESRVCSLHNHTFINMRAF